MPSLVDVEERRRAARRIATSYGYPEPRRRVAWRRLLVVASALAFLAGAIVELAASGRLG